MREPGLSWTAQEDAILASGWKRGESLTQIARQLPGRTANAVNTRRHRMGLPGRGKQQPVVKPEPAPVVPRAGKTTLPPLTCLGN